MEMRIVDKNNSMDYLKEMTVQSANIAMEVYIAEKCTRLNYSDLWDTKKTDNTGYVTIRRLTAWLNNAPLKSGGIRKGVIDSYIENCKQDFDEEGKWQACCFPSFIQYMKSKLEDKKFTKKKKIADQFTLSFKDEEWFYQTVAVAGLKLSERLYSGNELRTEIAKTLIRSNFQGRKMLDEIGKMVGRSIKFQSYYNDEQQRAKFYELVNSTFKKGILDAFGTLNNSYEYKVYLNFKDAIERQMKKIYSSALPVRNIIKTIPINSKQQSFL